MSRLEEAHLDELSNVVLSRGRMQGMGDVKMDSEVVFPVVKNQSFVRFELQNRGILDSDSVVQVSLKNVNSNEVIPPIMNGAYAWLEKAVLRIGGNTICTTENQNYLKASTVGQTPSDDQKNLNTYLEGSNAYFSTTDLFAETTAGTTNEFSGSLRVGGRSVRVPNPFLKPQLLDSASPKFSWRLDTLFPFLVDNQIPLYTLNDPVYVELTLNTNDVEGSFFSYDASLVGGADVVELTIKSALVVGQFSIDETDLVTSGGSGEGLTLDVSTDGAGALTVANISTAGTGYKAGDVVKISNADLGTLAPLEPVGVDLFFTIDAISDPVASSPYAVGDASFILDDFKLFCTHLYYEDAIMNRIKSRHDSTGLRFLYDDYQFVQRGVQANTTAEGSQRALLDIGGQGKLVRSMVVAKHIGSNSGEHIGLYDSPDGNAGYYTTDTGVRTGFNSAEETYQFQINDELAFTRPLDESAKLSYHYSTVGRAGANFIPKAVYSNESQTSQFINANWLGTNQTNLDGVHAPRGFFWGRDHENTEGNGYRIGMKPIRMEYSRSATTNLATGDLALDQALTFRVWLKIEKEFMLRNGMVDTAI